MNPSQTAALLIGYNEHHIDHLAPLCAYLEIPLFIADQQIYHLVSKFYPSVDARAFNKNVLLENYTAFISCYTNQVLQTLFAFDTRFSQLTIWCPHGNSDKGQNAPLMESLRGEDVVLYYGKKMLDFIKDRNAFSSSCQYIRIGNYRKAYYEKHKSFYSNLYRKEISNKLLTHSCTYLYAPTWNDYEQNSSLVTCLPQLMQRLPSEMNLIVKVHPNDLQLMSPETLQLIYRADDKKNILILEKFPPIYPILDQVDGYIGDMSSVGYDFLGFNKPMFFDTKRKSALFRCGENISSFPNQIDGEKSREREKLYDYTFSKPIERNDFWKVIREAVTLKS